MYQGETSKNLKMITSKDIYNFLIEDEILLPRGVLKWCQELRLSNTQITNCFTFAKKCTGDVFKQVFQYKVGVNITPTNEYLHRYQVLDSDMCGKCEDHETDTIIHSLWDCISIQPFLRQILNNVVEWTGIDTVTMEQYLFGLGKDGCIIYRGRSLPLRGQNVHIL